MSESNSLSFGPSPYIGAIVGAGGIALIAFSAAGNADTYALVVGLVALGGIVAVSKSASFRPALALGLALNAIILGVMVHFTVKEAFHQPLVRDICDLDLFDAGLRVFGVFALFVLGVWGAIAFALARFLAPRAQLMATPLRLLNFAALAGICALLAWTLPNKLARLTPERYIESLPMLGVVPAATGEPTRIKEDNTWYANPSAIAKYDVLIYETPMAKDLIARRYCRQMKPGVGYPIFGSNCSLVVRKVGTISDAEESNFYRPLGRLETIMNEGQCNLARLDVAADASFVLRDDEAHGVLVLEGSTHYALDRRTFALRGVKIRDIMPGTSSPRGWLIAAALGLVVAVAFEVLRFRASRGLMRIANAVVGTVGRDGWLNFENGSPPVFVGVDGKIPAGPVLVLSNQSPATAHSPYRGDALPANTEILSGSKQEVLAQERWKALSPWDALSLSVLVVAAMPLATWWISMR